MQTDESALFPLPPKGSGEDEFDDVPSKRVD
jgi:hypothetical protein